MVRAGSGEGEPRMTVREGSRRMELGSRASGQAGGLGWRQGLKGPGLRGRALPARFLPAQSTRQC